jgi:hypothetical protein
MSLCDICGARLESRLLGPHKSVHARQAKARYIYKPDDKHPYEMKPCQGCGEVALIRKKGRFCSYRCSKMGQLNPRWKGDAAKRASARLRAHRVAIDRSICAGCGVAGVHQRHHVDGDVYNNDPANLKPLCPSCHGKEHRRLARMPCAVCGVEAAPGATYCSRACFGFSCRGRKRGGRAAA